MTDEPLVFLNRLHLDWWILIDDISEKEKRLHTVDDLLDKFAELRKAERLTDEMLEELRREYI